MLRTVRQKLGFTIVEIVVVVALIGVLVAIGVVSWRALENRAYNNRTLHAMTSYRDAFELYATQEKHYPPVPQAGSYCLHYGGLTGPEINARWPAEGLPATITAGGVTETSYFCRDFLDEGTTQHASYPPLTRAIDSVLTLKLPQENSAYLADLYAGGVWAHYSDTPAAVTITIFGYITGTTCPPDTAKPWGDARVSICSLQLSKRYPVTFTAETWPYAT